MSPISTSARVVVSSDQVSAELTGETIVLGMADGTYYGLPGVGARVWSLIQEERTVGEVRDALVQEYDVEPERCLLDLRRLLADLIERRLVVLTDPA